MRESTARTYSPEPRRSGQGQKRSSHPTQPGSHSTGYSYRRRKKPMTILQRAVYFCKRVRWKKVALLVLACMGVFFLIRTMFTIGTEDKAAAPTITVSAQPTPQASTPVYIFRDGDGYPIDWKALTDAWAAEAGFSKRYMLTDEERLVVAQVVTAEAAGEPYAGKVAVAQCILQAAEDDGIRPDAVVIKYGYTKRRPDPSTEALAAVADVFDFGNVASTEPIKYFYAPAWTDSEWHESQVYVMTINGHRFFKEATEE